MKKFVLIPVLALACSVMSIAQNKGTVDAKMLNDIRSSFKLDASSKAIQNAIFQAISFVDADVNTHIISTLQEYNQKDS